MKRWTFVIGIATALAAGAATAQDTPDTLEAINADFEKAYKGLETQKIERLAKLAAAQPRDKANATYELLFRTAIGAGLTVETEAAAKRLLKSKSYSTTAGWLAAFVAILAEAKRGAYDDSVATLDAVLHAAQDAKAANPQDQISLVLPEPQRVALIDAYYQILVQADQFDAARKAMELIGKKADSEIIRKMAANRIRQLNLVGKAAPAFQAKDLDGKPVRLADLKGQPVLLEFWTTWSLPSIEEMESFDRMAQEQASKGLRVILVNVDAMEEGKTAEAVLPGVRKFAVDHNIRWPIVADQPGPASLAAVFGVSEIPASVLLDKQGIVVHLDMRRSNLEAKVVEELAR